MQEENQQVEQKKDNKKTVIIVCLVLLSMIVAGIGFNNAIKQNYSHKEQLGFLSKSNKEISKSNSELQNKLKEIQFELDECRESNGKKCGAIGCDYSVESCNRECNYSVDCKHTCGCGAINKWESCFNEGIENNCIDSRVECVDHQCIEGEDFPPYVPKNLLKKEYEDEVTVSDGYILVSSILSNDKTKIVYTEITDSIRRSESNWRYDIYVKDLTTSEVVKLYSDPLKMKDEFSIRSLFIKDAKAGGCRSAYLPMAWSPNDEKIILSFTNPTTCGSGRGDIYRYYVMNSGGGEIVKLAGDLAVFDYEYRNVAFVERGENSPKVCNGVNDNNFSRILYSEIEKENSYEKVLLAEENAKYNVLNLNKEGVLEYSIEKYLDQECAEIDDSKPKEVQKINIKN